MHQILKVGFVGAPNSGKSTLLNSLVGEKISIVTHLRNTTRTPINGVLTRGSKQLLFYDTPGVVHSGDVSKVSQQLVRSSLQVLPSMDRVCILVDSTILTKPGLPLVEQYLCNKLGSLRIPSILVLTKWDLANSPDSRETVSRHINELKLMIPSINQVFAISGKCSEDVYVLQNHLLSLARPGEWFYESGVVSTQTLQQRLVELVREQFMLRLPKELPYRIEPEILSWSIEPKTGITSVSISVKIPHKRIAQLVKKYIPGVQASLRNELLILRPKMLFKLKITTSVSS